MRILPAAGETGATWGARDGATSASGGCARAGADRFGERNVRSLGSTGEKRWRENGSRREGEMRGRDSAVWRGREFGETRGATGCTGAASVGCERSMGK